MKLEAVNPVDPGEICIATVTKVKESYLWLQLEGKCPLREQEACPALTLPQIMLVHQSHLEID